MCRVLPAVALRGDLMSCFSENQKIAVIGSLNLDMTVCASHLPQPGETLTATGFSTGCGGKGGNQACAIARLGGDISMFGAVGDDSAGTMLREKLRASGADVSHVTVLKDVPSGTALIVVDSAGKNSICVVPGANQMVTPAYLESQWDSLSQAQIFLMQMEIPIETVLYAARRAKAEGKTVILDPAPACANQPDELFSLTDLIKPNETELGILTNRSVSRGNVLECCSDLHRRGAATILVSLGSEGSLLSRLNETPLFFPVADYPAVDTTAAGDSFLGAITVQLANGNSIEQAIMFATRVAALTVSRRGAQDSIPYLNELDNIPEAPSPSFFI